MNGFSIHRQISVSSNTVGSCSGNGRFITCGISSINHFGNKFSYSLAVVVTDGSSIGSGNVSASSSGRVCRVKSSNSIT